MDIITDRAMGMVTDQRHQEGRGTWVSTKHAWRGTRRGWGGGAYRGSIAREMIKLKPKSRVLMLNDSVKPDSG